MLKIEKATLIENEVVALDVDGELILFGKAEGQYWSVSGICPHENFPMKPPKSPYLRQQCIICPLHGARFDIFTGHGLNQKAQDGLKQYRVTVTEVGEYLYLDVQPSSIELMPA